MYAGLRFIANWAETTSSNVTTTEVIGCWEAIMEDTPTKKENFGAAREFPPQLPKVVVHKKGEKGRSLRIFNLPACIFNRKMSSFGRSPGSPEAHSWRGGERLGCLLKGMKYFFNVSNILPRLVFID